MSRRSLLLTLILLLALPCSFLHAGKGELPSKGFSIQPSSDWIELPLPFQGVVVSYGKKGTLATFHITERDLEGSKDVEANEQTVRKAVYLQMLSDLYPKEVDLYWQSIQLLGVDSDGIAGSQASRYAQHLQKTVRFK